MNLEIFIFNTTFFNKIIKIVEDYVKATITYVLLLEKYETSRTIRFLKNLFMRTKPLTKFVIVW